MPENIKTEKETSKIDKVLNFLTWIFFNKKNDKKRNDKKRDDKKRDDNKTKPEEVRLKITIEEKEPNVGEMGRIIDEVLRRNDLERRILEQAQKYLLTQENHTPSKTRRLRRT